MEKSFKYSDQISPLQDSIQDCLTSNPIEKKLSSKNVSLQEFLHLILIEVNDKNTDVASLVSCSSLKNVLASIYLKNIVDSLKQSQFFNKTEQTESSQLKFPQEFQRMLQNSSLENQINIDLFIQEMKENIDNVLTKYKQYFQDEDIWNQVLKLLSKYQLIPNEYEMKQNLQSGIQLKIELFQLEEELKSEEIVQFILQGDQQKFSELLDYFDEDQKDSFIMMLGQILNEKLCSQFNIKCQQNQKNNNLPQAKELNSNSQNTIFQKQKTQTENFLIKITDYLLDIRNDLTEEQVQQFLMSQIQINQNDNIYKNQQLLLTENQFQLLIEQIKIYDYKDEVDQLIDIMCKEETKENDNQEELRIKYVQNDFSNSSLTEFQKQVINIKRKNILYHFILERIDEQLNMREKLKKRTKNQQELEQKLIQKFNSCINALISSYLEINQSDQIIYQKNILNKFEDPEYNFSKIKTSSKLNLIISSLYTENQIIEKEKQYELLKQLNQQLISNNQFQKLKKILLLENLVYDLNQQQQQYTSYNYLTDVQKKHYQDLYHIMEGNSKGEVFENFMKCMYSYHRSLFDSQLIKQTYKNDGLTNAILPYFQTFLKQSMQMVQLFNLKFLEVKKNSKNQVYSGMKEIDYLIILLEKLKNPIDRQTILENFSLLAQPLPFMYFYYTPKINDVAMIWRLDDFRYILSKSIPIIISIGSEQCGKIKLLNQLFLTNFKEYTEGQLIKCPIELSQSTEKLAHGFNIFDVHGSCLDKQKIEYLLKILEILQCWIFVHISDYVNIIPIKKLLDSLGIQDQQVIYFYRERESISTEEGFEFIQEEVWFKNIKFYRVEFLKSKNENENWFLELKKSVFRQIGYNTTSKFPIQQKKNNQHKNNYIQIQNRAAQLIIERNMILEKTGKIEFEFLQQYEKKLEDIEKEYNGDYKNRIFIIQSFVEKINYLKIQRSQLAYNNDIDIQTKREKSDLITKELDIFDKQMNQQLPHHLVVEYLDLLLIDDVEKIQIIDRCLNFWQEIVMHQDVLKRSEIKSEIKQYELIIEQDYKKFLNEAQKQNLKELDQKEYVKNKISSSKISTDAKSELTKFKNQLQKINICIEQKSVNKEYIMRELFYIFNNCNLVSNIINKFPKFNLDKFQILITKKFLNGQSIELVDGDNSEINKNVLKGMFDKIGDEVEKIQNEPFKFLPVSIIGPQSTGKSTLVNMMFGADFKVSAGRCTRGMDVSLKKLEYKHFKHSNQCLNHNVQNNQIMCDKSLPCWEEESKIHNILVMDTEGLFSIEKSDEKFDRKLTLFSMACSKLMIINVNGEINQTMKKILAMAVFAGKKINRIGHKPHIVFVLRNMKDSKKDNLEESVQKIRKELEEVAQINNVELHECLEFKGEESLILMKDAFSNEPNCIEENKTAYDRVYTGIDFIYKIEDLKEKIISSYENYQSEYFNQWFSNSSATWASIQDNFSLFDIDSIKEINDRNNLSKDLDEIKQLNFEKFKQDLQVEFNIQKQQLEKDINEIIEIQNKGKRKINDLCEQSKKKIIFEFQEKTKKKYQNLNLLKEFEKHLSDEIDFIQRQNILQWEEICLKEGSKNTTKSALQEVNKTIDNLLMKQSNSNKNELVKEYDEFVKKERLVLEENQKKMKQKREKIEETVLYLLKSAYNSIPIQERFFDLSTCIAYYERNQKGIKFRYENLQAMRNFSQMTEQTKNDLFELFQYIPSDEQKSQILEQKKKNQEQNIKKKSFFESLKSTFLHKDDSSLPQQNQQLNENNQSIQTKQINQVLQKIKSASIDILDHIQNYILHSYQLECKCCCNCGCKCKCGCWKVCEQQCTCSDSQNVCIKDCTCAFQNQKTLGLSKQNFNEQIECIQTFLYIIEQDSLSLYSVQTSTSLINEIFAKIISYNVQYLIDKQEQKYRIDIKSFEEKLKDLRKDFENNLDGSLTDAQNAVKMFENLVKRIKSFFMDQGFDKFQSQITKDLELEPQQFIQKCEEVMNGSNQNLIYQYITDPNKYMKNYFMENIVKEKSDIIIKTQIKLTEKDILNYINQIIDRIHQLKQFSQKLNGNLTDKQKIEIAQLNYKLFELVINTSDGDRIQKQSCEILKILNQQNQFQFQMSPLSSTNKLFQEPTGIFSIKNLFLFCEKIASQLIELIKNNQLSPRIQLSIHELSNHKKLSFDTCFQISYGCPEKCPYCGVKCDKSIVHKHDDHRSLKHRWMAFNGSQELIKENQKGFIFDFCNSEINLKSNWSNKCKEATINSFKKLIHERISLYNCFDGEVNFTLEWNNDSYGSSMVDLDLYVQCPCGTIIYFGQRECTKCQSYLDKDHRYESKAIEHVYIKTLSKNLAEQGGEWKYWVQYFGYSGQQRPCGYTVYVEQKSLNGSIQRQNETISTGTLNSSEKSQVYGYIPSVTGKSFRVHLSENNKTWSKEMQQISTEKEQNWINTQNNCWKHIGDRIAQDYGIPNNKKL